MVNAQQSVEALNEQANVQNESVQAVVEDFNQLPVIEAADSAPTQTQETGKVCQLMNRHKKLKHLFLQKMQRKNRSSKGKDNFYIFKNKHILITAGNRGGKKMDKLAKNQFILLLIRTILLQGTKLVFCLVWVSLLFMVGSI